MSVSHIEPRCSLCMRPAEYDTPDWLCRYHWVDWFLAQDEIIDKDQLKEERNRMLVTIWVEYGPPPEYWYHKLIRELEAAVEKSSESQNP